MGLRVTRLPDEAAATKAKLRVAAGEAGVPPVLELEGEFDLDTVPEIDRFLRRSLGPLYHQDHLVIDLACTTFIDSSFIAFLVRLSAAQRAKRRELLLVASRGPGAARAGDRRAAQHRARVRHDRGSEGKRGRLSWSGDPAGVHRCGGREVDAATCAARRRRGRPAGGAVL